MGFNSVAVILNDYISGGSTDISPGIAWAVQRFPAHSPMVCNAVWCRLPRWIARWRCN